MPHVSPAPTREGSRQHVTRVSQWAADGGSGPHSGGVRFVVRWWQPQWRRFDGDDGIDDDVGAADAVVEEGWAGVECDCEGEKAPLGRGGVDRVEGERSALLLEWKCARVWGGWCCRLGLRDKGTGMVKCLAIHRPREREAERQTDRQRSR